MVKLKKLLKHLETIRGRHTELISLYIPSGYNIQEIQNMLKQEYALTQNVKSRVTRHNVLDALEKVSNHLRLFKQTPPNGLIVFCGNISKKEGQTDIKIWSIEPPQPLAQRIYWCDQTFVLDPLKDMLREKEVYGLIVIDTGGADIGFLKGKKVILEKHIDSLVPGKTTKGGWCVGSMTYTVLKHKIDSIKNVSKENNPILSFNFDKNRFYETKINWIKKRIPNKAYRIVTKHPTYEIKATPEHVFFVITKDGIIKKHVEDLEIGDSLIGVSKINIVGKTKNIEVKIPHKYLIKKEGREFLIKKRKKNNIYQKEVAEALNLSQTIISKFEIGQRNLKIENLKKLLRVYGISEKKFFKRFIVRKPLIRFPKKTNEKFCQIIGYILGDGTFDNNRIILYDANKGLLQKYEKMVRDQFNVNTSIIERNARNYYELRIYSLYLAEIIKKHFGSIFLLTQEKSIPDVIYSLPKKQTAGFIRGLFDAEGYLTRRHNSIVITMSSEKVIRGLQLILLRYGIVSSIGSSVFGFSKKRKYRLMINDKNSIRLFSKYIGFTSLEKQSKLSKLTENVLFSNFATRSMKIPIKGSEILDLAKKIGLEPSNFNGFQNFLYDHHGISNFIFRSKIIPIFEARLSELKKSKANINSKAQCKLIIDHLKKIANSGIIELKVAKKEPIIPNGYYYDISLQKYYNFVANGLIIHNSQQRYARIREEAKRDHLKKVSEIADSIFKQEKDLKGVIIGGPGPFKQKFYEGDYLDYQLRDKRLGLVDTSYTGIQGLQELVKRGENLIQEASAVKERKVMERFFSNLQKENGLSVYGLEEVKRAINLGAVEILLVSEDFDWVRRKFKCQCGNEEEKDTKPDKIYKCPNCGAEMNVEKETDLIDVLSEGAKNMGSSVEIVSVDSREGIQFKELGGIGAILRFKIE